jgi:hypothetical protein
MSHDNKADETAEASDRLMKQAENKQQQGHGRSNTARVTEAQGKQGNGAQVLQQKKK